jgi:hypothetical protein
MAKKRAKGSIIYEILIVILAAVLVATLLYPKSVWKDIDHGSMLCEDRMSRIADAQGLYISFHDTHNFDSSLVNVIEYISNDSIFGLDSTSATLRDSFYVKLLVDYFRDYQDLGTKIATDSAFNLIDVWRTDSLVAMQVDSTVDFMFASLYTCPTSGDTYRVEVVDTSALKILKVFCPLDSTEIDSINSDFWFRMVGGGEVKNHGSIDNSDRSWEARKRK